MSKKHIKCQILFYHCGKGVKQLKNQNKVAIRNELIERLRYELVGPNEEHELIDELPTQRYLTGILWPSGEKVRQEEDDHLGAGQEGEETGPMETVAPLNKAMLPSSMGLSFVVEPGIEKLEVQVSWGQYRPVTEGSDTEERWKRDPIVKKRQIRIDDADGVRKRDPLDENKGVFLEWLSRPLGKRIAVSVFIVNRQKAPEKGPKDFYCLFQPEIRVSSTVDGQKPFGVRELKYEPGTYRPLDVMMDELLYREQTVFAVGHGTAVKWDEVSPDNQYAGVLATVTIPVYEIPMVTPPPWNGHGNLNMDDIAISSNADTLCEYLEPLADAYDDWIYQRELELDSFSGELRSTAEENINQCKKSLSRIRKGIDLIRSNQVVFEAFRFANRAMAMQRLQSKWSRQARKTKDWSRKHDSEKPSWRPFQIAFILQSLTGIVEPTHDDRDICDLLWFPTGGGKTEAYLGLAAFTMALRRLRGEQDGKRGDAGVNVIMRYTLRLLTIQQFQRAATLICACEKIRQEQPERWGHVPFRIGLWVGGKSTPNDFDEVVKDLTETNPGGRTPIQLVSCPWCGSPLGKKDYFPDKRRRRLIIGCSRRECDFHRTNNPDGIPALVNDEEIYRYLPAMLIGTVDKFARLPWVGETQTLFGNVKSELDLWGFTCEGESERMIGFRNQVLGGTTPVVKDQRELLPPELIIQDELHLIGGPLGTMVGIYETAIDYLASREIRGKLVGPKVIASTATIRRAEDQVKLLFARKLAIFPPPGLVSGDSFFARQQPLDKTPGRTYLGIFAPGRSVKTALVRVYSTLLASTGAMKAFSADDLDPYQTMVGYFNSLRELGGAVRLIEDDVRARMNVLANRPTSQKYSYVSRELDDEVPELTSRVDSKDIPAILDRLERSFTEAGSGKERPVDVVLASNMISVGVDVSRLGLMVVNGQPKTTSEYIQATSRVGREHPGLVITVYNWARPRDVSHYERFISYHSALYRYVEAISVTPYSSRARDRALAAVLVSMCRLKIRKLSKRENAVHFKSRSPETENIKKYILRRVNTLEGASRLREVDQDLKMDVDLWEKETAKDVLLYDGGCSNNPRLLYPLGNKKKNGVFGTPNSMRDVEPPIGIYLRKGD
jgi:hypothetical protein